MVIPIVTTGHIADKWVYYYLTGKGPTYFLLALTQFTLLNPILQKHKNNKVWNFIFLLVTPLYLAFYYSFNFKTGHEFQPEQFFCFPWFTCYYLGLKLQDISLLNKIKGISNISAFALCIGLLLLSNLEAFFIFANTGIYSFAISQITFGSVVYSIGIIVFFVTLWRDESVSKRTVLSSVGDYSMGIFLVHPTFNWIFKYMALHIPGGTEVYSSKIGFAMIHLAILVLSVSASYYTSKSLSNKFPRLILPLGLK